MAKINLSCKNNVYAVVKNKDCIKIIKGSNIITDEGDKYYAQKIVGESTDFDSPGFRLGSDDTPPAKTDTDVISFIEGSAIDIAANYPIRNDTDVNNGGGGEKVLTWKIEYPEGQLNSTEIKEGAIVDNKDTPTKAINRFLFDETLTVSSTDSLTIYINHELEGV